MTLQGLSPYSEQHRGWNEWERQKSTQRSRKKKKKNKGRVGPIHLSVHVCFGDFWSVTQAIPCQPSLLADTEEVALNAACCACVALESREGCLEGEHSHSFKGYLKNAALCPVTCCSSIKPDGNLEQCLSKKCLVLVCIPSASDKISPDERLLC